MKDDARVFQRVSHSPRNNRSPSGTQSIQRAARLLRELAARNRQGMRLIDVAPDGRIRLVDYKSGRSPAAGFEAKALFQMKFYALVIWRLRGVVPAMLQLIYLGNGEILRYEPDEDDLRATERKVEAVWAAIRRAQESGVPSALSRR